jgi:hypothetical protein
MLRTSHFRFLIFCLCIIAVSGCQFGEAHFESDPSSQKSFRPTGTVFAYIDAHDPQLQIRDNPRLHIIMSWLVFNPNDDLSTIQGSRLEDMRHEILLRDLMTMHFYPSTEATKGSQLESIVSHADILSDGRFVAHVLPAPEILDEDDSFNNYAPLGSLRSVEISIDAAGFNPNQSIVTGRLTIDIQPDIADPENALSRVWTGAFSAPVIEERLAEKNISILGLTEYVSALNESINDIAEDENTLEDE